MKNKKILSLFLCLAMLISICSPAALAESNATCITVPNGTELFVGQKPNNDSKHYVKFTECEPVSVSAGEDSTSYYYDLTAKKQYNYRITSEDYITYAGLFKNTDGFSLEITPEMLANEGKTKSSVDRDTSATKGANVANIYLNINAQGYLKLDSEETYQLVPLRTWQAVKDTSGNYFFEPDYHFTVIDENGESSDVVSVDENGLVTAEKDGTAIVLVTYDALCVDFGSGKSFFGALWPENTGVFVVTVGDSDSGIDTGITINNGKNAPIVSESDTIENKLSADTLDSELDCIYFLGEAGEYTFTPKTDGCSVSVANPTVDTALSYNGFTPVEANADASFTVPLKAGRNIVKLTRGEDKEYHIITARSVSVTVNNGEPVRPGDSLSIAFDRLYHPANKLAGVYNMSAVPVYNKVPGYESKLVGGLPAQYNFASSANAQTVENVITKQITTWGMFSSVSYVKDAALTVPDDYPYDTFTLSDGAILTYGFGDPYGGHRNITLSDGKDPNFEAEYREAQLARLPDITVPIAAPSGELLSITLDTTGVKTDYYSGESFDTTNLTVTANYSDEKAQLATSYTVTPEILTADTENVTVEYRGQTAVIPVSVTVDAVNEINITKMPSKTSYKAGNAFDPTGMVVTAVYDSGRSLETNDYSYAPNRLLEASDTEVTVTYTGTDRHNDLSPALVPISVSEGSGGSISDTVTVYFTLYGDSSHGSSKTKHTMAANNLEEWISKTALTVEKGSNVLDVITSALSIAGIPYTNEGNYISSIRGLSAMDNGSLSGWMYTVNGKYPNLGVEEQKVKNGDRIVFHYTDDYTAEESALSYSGGSLSSGSSSSSDNTSAAAYDKSTVTSDASAYIYKAVSAPSVGSVGGEWTILALARSGADVPAEYFEAYYNNVKSYVKSVNGVLHSTKNTEYSRVILALASIGKNPENVGGFNLVTPLEDYEKTILQGINGPAWALIALDSGNYGSDAVREKYISYILEKEISGGGWALSDSITTPNVDVTAMVLTALSRYTDRPEVAAAVERGIGVLSSMQNANGGYDLNGVQTSESCAQVLVALSSLGISHTDKRFVKNGKSLLDNMLSFYIEGEGFAHTDSSNLMATEQCLYALAAVNRLEAGQCSLFDMSDCAKTADTESAYKKSEIIYPGKTFADIAAHECREAVDALAERGIVSGMSEESFSPDSTMTRAEFTSIAVRALGAATDNSKIFDDVNESDWFFGYVAAAYRLGIVSGISETEFNPNGTITLEEAASMVARAAKLCGITTDIDSTSATNILAEFTDYKEVSDWSFTSVAFCFAGGILDRSAIQINPKQAVTRAQIAVMLYKLLGKAELL